MKVSDWVLFSGCIFALWMYSTVPFYVFILIGLAYLCVLLVEEGT